MTMTYLLLDDDVVRVVGQLMGSGPRARGLPQHGVVRLQGQVALRAGRRVAAHLGAGQHERSRSVRLS